MSHPPSAHSDSSGSAYPDTEAVSVIMAVRNEERYLEESVGSVLGQDYQGVLQVVLAVGPSRDRTLAVAQRLAAADPRIALVDNPAGQIPSGPNAALLAPLIGFPVAVVRAQLLLELAGNPATSQLWAETGLDDDGGITQASFPVQLGSSTRAPSDSAPWANPNVVGKPIRTPAIPTQKDWPRTETAMRQRGMPRARSTANSRNEAAVAA